MKKLLLLFAVLTLGVACTHEHELVCETVTIETRDYHDNGANEDALGRYDNITHEFEDCF